MKRIVFITNIPSPYQIKWSKELKKHYDIQFWFFNSIEKSVSNRPSYWNIEIPNYCRILPSKFKKYEICYGPTLKRELDKFNPDIIWLGGAWFMIAWMQAYRWAIKHEKKIIAGPIEFSEGSFSYIRILKNNLIYSLLYRKIDSYLCNGYKDYDIIGNVASDKKRYIFMNSEDYEPYFIQNIRKPDNIITFMYGGTISRIMRIPELLTTFESLARKYKNVRLILAGYGPEKKLCKKNIDNSKILSKNVEWFEVNAWDDIPKAYQRGDIFVIYAKYSAGSFSTMYGIASGMGIISTLDVTVARRYIINGYNGFLIKDERTLYEAMERYVLNPNLIPNHGKKNKEIARNEKYEEKIREFSKIIEELYSN
jgi:glycosyltransferase involved in cell wall biosynthesis